MFGGLGWDIVDDPPCAWAIYSDQWYHRYYNNGLDLIYWLGFIITWASPCDDEPPLFGVHRYC